MIKIELLIKKDKCIVEEDYMIVVLLQEILYSYMYRKVLPSVNVRSTSCHVSTPKDTALSYLALSCFT